MSRSEPIRKIYRQWTGRLVFKASAWLVLMVLFGWSLSSLIGFVPIVMTMGVLVALVMAVFELRKAPKESDVVRLINEQFNSTEYSTELIFESRTEGIIALQKARVLEALDQELPRFTYPIYWKDLLWAMALAITLFSVFWGYNSTSNSTLRESETAANNTNEKLPVATSDSVFLRNSSVVISPPEYTGLRSREVTDLDVSAPEQSKLQWKLDFSGKPEAVWISLSSGDSLPLTEEDDNWRATRKPSQNELYTINYLNDDGLAISSEYHEIQLVNDEPPSISIEGIPQFQRLDYRKGLSLKMDVLLSDDYALTNGYLTATITKGSGESVKFREQRIPFKREVRGDSYQTKIVLNLDDFGMEPGNELYFYGSAFDNKEPEKQQSRTETFFYILEDTSELEFSLQGALGIDLMPDYFRSQLQIILDTEKLIREKSQLTEYEFNFESNALGFDQKQLRLKYGQFIGEEEDSGLEIEQEDAPEAPDASGENVLDEFGHNTDKENEEGQWMDRGTEHDHEDDHDHEGDPMQEDNPLEAFMHNHEDEETSTFYTQTLKSKLRAALNEMWSAELYLRLYKPHESLPYQYKAQKLLKEIRNHARIYVQRIGFDPPPVNEAEARLTGKLKELNKKPFNQSAGTEKEYPTIREAIVIIDQLDEFNTWDSEIKGTIRTAGDELAGLAIEFPGKYLSTLNQLRSVLALKELTNTDLGILKDIGQVMALALPKEKELPSSTNRPNSEMTKLFIENLLKSSSK